MGGEYAIQQIRRWCSISKIFKLLHKKINYIKKKNKINQKECSIEDLKDYLKFEDTIKFDVLNFLTYKERKILELHIVEKRSYNEISKEFYLKPESIRKIKYRAINKIKRWRKENEKWISYTS